jgi:transcriptional regulator GlxA family with amidase domain
MRRHVAILVFDQVEILDFAGPHEVFGVADEIGGGRDFDVFTVAAQPGPVQTRHGLRLTPTYTFADCPAPHLLVIPGGYGTRALVHKAAVVGWIRERAATAELTMSVCTGAILLGQAGLLDGLRATTHHECLDLLREQAPRADVVGTERFVDNGRIVTAAGISAGIDCALHVVQRLLGAAAAADTARYMEYRRA